MKRTKSFCVVLAITLTFIISLSANAQTKPASRYSLSFDGFGPIRIGMTVSTASKALGVPFRGTPDSSSDNCYYMSPKRGFKNVGFMIINRRIARVDVSGKGYATDLGAEVGDTEARIKQLYKKVKVSPHPYVDGHYLDVSDPTGRFRIIFETDGKRVTSFRAGKFQAVGYIEGCS